MRLLFPAATRRLTAVRVLVVTNLFPPVVRGGYEVECAGVVEHLRARGDEVLVLTSEHGRRQAADEPGVRRELPLLPVNPVGALRAPAASVRAARTMRTRLASFAPDLVYVWNGAQLPHAAIRIAALSGVPLAFRVCEHWFGRLYTGDQFMRHLLGDDRGLRRAWAALVRVVARHPALRLDLEAAPPAAICWNSDMLRERSPVPALVRAALEDKIYPATSQSSRLAGVERHPTERPRLVFIGRVAPEKGLEVAYRALALLRSGHRVEADLVVAGRLAAGMAGRLRRLARELSIEGEVTLAGPLGTEGLAEVLGGAHVVVIPPTWEEPAPLVCVEAAIARVPVVAARSGGIPEMLHDGEHALLFEIGDAAGCAAAVAETLRDHSAAAARVERAFARAQQLGYDRYLDATERFLNDALDALRPPSVRAGRS